MSRDFSHLPAPLATAITNALAVVERTYCPRRPDYPDDATKQLRYPPRAASHGEATGGNVGWTTGFVPGMLWLAHELTGANPADQYAAAGTEHLASFTDRLNRQVDVDHHDLGFLYTLSCANAWHLTGSEPALETALQAAKRLYSRYLPGAEVIQAWGALDDPDHRGRAIIDSLMNLPLLHWAGRRTGDAEMREAAKLHAHQLRRRIVRANGSTYHTFFWDPETGAPLRGETAQGFSNESCWARGQAWGIYGFTLSYRYCNDQEFLDTAIRCADYYLAHQPDDQVAFWDLSFEPNSTEERDTSAAAIAACGLLELAAAADRTDYRQAAHQILSSLATKYATTADEDADCLLREGVYNRPLGIGVNEGNLWGDYYYLEALLRVADPNWQPYWLLGTEQENQA